MRPTSAVSVLTKADYQERVLELVSEEFEADKWKGEPKGIKAEQGTTVSGQVEAAA